MEKSMFLEAVEITRNVLHDYIFKCESRSKAIYFTREGKNSELMPISDCIYCFFRLTCPNQGSTRTAFPIFPLGLSEPKLCPDCIY